MADGVVTMLTLTTVLTDGMRTFYKQTLHTIRQVQVQCICVEMCVGMWVGVCVGTCTVCVWVSPVIKLCTARDAYKSMQGYFI